MGTIDLSTDPKAADLSGVLSQALNRSIERVIGLGKSKLDETVLREREAELRAKYVESIADGTWVSAFRGRDVLRRFVGKRAPTVSYEVFRNLLLSQMKDQGYRPKVWRLWLIGFFPPRGQLGISIHTISSALHSPD